MSLATRCTACGTIFRVVQDQLRVSEGWVRCGRCAEVFDAGEQLFDLEHDAPPPWPPSPPPQPRPAPASARPVQPPPGPSSTDEPTWELPPDEDDAPPPAPESAPRPVQRPVQRSVPRSSPPAPAQDTATAARASVDSQAESPPELAFALSSFGQDRREPFFGPSGLNDGDVEADTGADTRADTPAQPTKSKDRPRSPSPATAPSTAPTPQAHSTAATRPSATEAALDDGVKVSLGSTVPSFMKEPRASTSPGVRSALWRWVMISASALLALTLLGQALLHHRDAIAAKRPALRPALQTLCAPVGCKISAWRHLEDVSVESSSLTLAGSGLHYKLQVQLRNKGAAEVALPWMDLSLTDAQGQLIARRMLSPQDFQIRQTTIGAHGEQALSLVFNASGQKVSGYTVEIFHP